MTYSRSVGLMRRGPGGDRLRFDFLMVPGILGLPVTAQSVAAAAGLPLVIGHAPGHMFIADILNEDLAKEE